MKYIMVDELRYKDCISGIHIHFFFCYMKMYTLGSNKKKTLKVPNSRVNLILETIKQP